MISAVMAGNSRKTLQNTDTVARQKKSPVTGILTVLSCSMFYSGSRISPAVVAGRSMVAPGMVLFKVKKERAA